jgi:hypothetical protein
MNIEQGLITYLIAQNVANKRIYPSKLPQNATLPAVVMKRVSQAVDYVQSGASGLEMGRFQLDIWGTTYASVKTVKAQVLTAVSGFKGVMGSATVGASFIANAVDMNDPDSQLIREVVDVKIWSNL